MNKSFALHCKNLRAVLTFYGYLSCTFYKHPVSDCEVPFTMATKLFANEVYMVVEYFLLAEN